MKGLIFLSLFIGFRLLFSQIRIVGYMTRLLKKTRWDMDAAARLRALEGRRRLIDLQQEHNLWSFLEKQLEYSGLKIRFPGLTAEFWIVGNLAAIAFAVTFLSVIFGFEAAVAVGAGFVAGEYLFFRCLRNRNLKAVNGHLMKLLDFLGNYSITAGDVTSVFYQVSRYMEEPIKGALDSCYYEAQTTGDLNMALLSMAEKVEHPKFKELVRNMEVSLRYCADLTALVAGSRRSMREYLRVAQERKGMLREALINMALLAGLSLVVLFAVGYLVQMSVAELLTGTLPGRIGLIVLAVIAVLFISQMQKMA